MLCESGRVERANGAVHAARLGGRQRVSTRSKSGQGILSAVGPSPSVNTETGMEPSPLTCTFKQNAAEVDFQGVTIRNGSADCNRSRRGCCRRICLRCRRGVGCRRCRTRRWRWRAPGPEWPRAKTELPLHIQPSWPSHFASRALRSPV